MRNFLWFRKDNLLLLCVTHLKTLLLDAKKIPCEGQSLRQHTAHWPRWKLHSLCYKARKNCWGSRLSKAHHYAPAGCLANQEMNHRRGRNAGTGVAPNGDWGGLSLSGAPDKPSWRQNKQAVFLSLTPLWEAPFSELGGNYGDSLCPVMGSLCSWLGATFTSTVAGLAHRAKARNIRSQVYNSLVSRKLNATTCLHSGAPAWAIQSWWASLRPLKKKTLKDWWVFFVVSWWAGGKIRVCCCSCLLDMHTRMHSQYTHTHTHRTEFGDSGILMSKFIACPASKFWEIRQPRIPKSLLKSISIKNWRKAGRSWWC